jgi:hypothetical protein
LYWANVYADTEQALPEAYKHLKTSKCFALNEVGIGLALSSDLQALRFLLAEPNAEALLLKLFHEGNPIAQIYALSGLKIKNPQLYLSLSLFLRKNNSEVLFDSSGGCIMFESQESPISDILNWHGVHPLLTYEDRHNRNYFKNLSFETEQDDERRIL